MESTQLPSRSEFSHYTKNLIDRSPASPTFLQRRIASHSSYENLYPPNNTHPNFFVTPHAVTTLTPPPTHSGGTRGIEPNHRAGSSAEDYINLKAYVGSNQTSPVKRSRNNSANVSNHLQPRVLPTSHVNSNVSPPLGDLSTHQQQQLKLQKQQNCFVNYGYCHEDEYENTASYMRPRANTAPSRRRPLVNGNYLDMSSPVGQHDALPGNNHTPPPPPILTPPVSNRVVGVQQDASTAAIQKHLMPLPTSGSGSLDVEASSLPGSPKFIPRKGSLPARFFQQTQQQGGGSGKQVSNQSAKQRTPPFCSACAQIAATLPSGWAVNETEEGIPYFIDHNSRSTHWRLPWLPPCLNCELIHNELMMEHGSTANATPGNQHSYTTNRPPPPPIPRRKPISSDEEKSPLLAPSVATHEAFVSGSSDGDQGFGVPSATSTAIHNQCVPPSPQLNKQPLRPIFTNYSMMDTIPVQSEGFQRVSTASSASLLDPMLPLEVVNNVGSRSSSSAYMPMYPSQQEFHFQSRHQEAMRRMPPARPLTRLPNALPLDVAVAEESSKRLVEELRSPASATEKRVKEGVNEETVLETDAEDAPKRPRHPSVESQLLYLLDSQPDFFMDTYYKADEKLDRMLDFNVFNTRHLEAMRDSLDRKYFEECQAVCAAYERYRVALTEKIQKKVEAELKEKHKRQLNHIKSTRSAKSNLTDHRNIDNISLSSLDFNNE
ncbi:uncharacterized protein LOC142345683 isoform X2 [Convolutriloba macropyga]|uniref:uncharacterized protein LOC142345683 isoform X2 n=1 Tax=Convolutriloba macropyga TaxID=536237 RepID=UPI003F51F5DC